MQGLGVGLGSGQSEGEEDVYQFVSGRSSELSKLMGEFDSLMMQLQNTQGQGQGPSKQQSAHSASDVGGSHSARDPALSRNIPSKVAAAPRPGPSVVSILSHPSTSHRSSAASASASHFAAYDNDGMHPLPSVTATTTTTTNQKLPHSTSNYPYPYPSDTESLSPGLGPGADDAGPSPNVSMQDLQLIDTLKVTNPLHPAPS